jgi:hypothetical protein
MEQLKVGTNDLPAVAKKKVVAAVVSMLSTEAFLTVSLPSSWRCPTTAVASIHGRKVGECWNSGLDSRLEVVVASIHLKVVAASIQLEATVAVTLEAARLRETLPTISRGGGPISEPCNMKV